MTTVTILGATGTIGINTLDVIERHPDNFQVFALTANTNVKDMLELCRKWQPRYAVMASEEAADRLQQQITSNAMEIEVLAGTEGLCEVSRHTDCDYVMAAIVGAAGLLPTLAAADAGKRVLLANKEALVMSGPLFMQAIAEHGAELLPIDSEHNAIFQCLPANFGQGLAQVGVSRILLTASGGPFREMTIEQLQGVTPEQAVAHPNWVMGRKISVDSATMMNKGLELIEACWLFDTTAEQIQVVLHPQSVIHSMVQYTDGSVLAELGNPDMRTPIAHALAWPERIESGVVDLDMFAVARLDFQEPDDIRFPCLRLAREAMQTGGTATTILNAANEVAVQAFLDGDIGFTKIAELIEKTMNNVSSRESKTIDIILEDDQQTRLFVNELLKQA